MDKRAGTGSSFTFLEMTKIHLLSLPHFWAMSYGRSTHFIISPGGMTGIREYQRRTFFPAVCREEEIPENKQFKFRNKLLPTLSNCLKDYFRRPSALPIVHVH